MVSIPYARLSGLGWSPAWAGHCVVGLGKTLTLVPPSTLKYKYVPVNLMLRAGKITLQWTSIPATRK